jgi:hypothetical protein
MRLASDNMNWQILGVIKNLANNNQINLLKKLYLYLISSYTEELILEVVYPMVMVAENAIFQEDNASIHKCNLVMV